MNIGLLWNTQISKTQIINGGISFQHLNQPNVSLYPEQQTYIDLRTTLHGSYQFRIAPKLDLIPGILMMFQGTNTEITPGANVKYTLNKNKFHYLALYGGIWTRANDAAFITMGMDWNTLNVGLSYDLTYSSLNVASQLRGGIELSVIYIIAPALPKRTHYKICPTYL